MLIRCPECNKEISISAMVCPNCGFNIQDALKKQQYEQEYYAILQRVKTPEKPELKKDEKVIDIILLVIAALGALVFLISCLIGMLTPQRITQTIAGIFLFTGLFLLLVTGIPLLVSLSNYRKACKEYDHIMQDLNTYKNKIARKIMRLKSETIIKCPYCDSIRVSKINAGDIINSALNNTNIYQWHCNSCKSEF